MTQVDLWTLENELRTPDTDPLCGVDEAGRGPLAGPVCAAAVMLPSPSTSPVSAAASGSAGSAASIAAAAVAAAMIRSSLFIWDSPLTGRVASYFLAELLRPPVSRPGL